MTERKLKAVSLFSGIGGFCEGVKEAGFEILCAVEKDKYAAENYRLNFPETPLFEGDIANFLNENSSEIYTDQLSEYIGQSKVDLLFGGPPCQGYSQIGPRDAADPRNELYLEMTRLATALNPKYILIENVPNMLLMKQGMFRERITSALNSAGYDNIGIKLFNAADYGVPQTRTRVFILAAKKEQVVPSMQGILEITAESMMQERVSVDEAIGDLPNAIASDSGVTLRYPDGNNLTEFQKEMRLDCSGVFYSKKDKMHHYSQHDPILRLHNHHTKDIRERRLNLIKLLAPGAKADSLPKEVWNNARPEKWRRFDGSLPAHTLLAQMHRDLSEWVHPHLNRWITVREALRLQSFHDGFVLKTSEWQMLKQVGNAVPPLLAYVPSMAIHLAEARKKGSEAPFELTGQPTLF